jgi:predicted MFS family arabinose efflux permease
MSQSGRKVASPEWVVRFYRYWWGEAASSLGNQIGNVAIPLLAVYQLRATSIQMGLLRGAETLAPLLFGWFIGAIVARRDSTSLMIFSDGARMCLLGVVASLAILHDLTLDALCIFLFALTALNLLFDNGAVVALPRVIPEEKLAWANGRIQMGVAVGDFAGPGVAGVLIQLLSAPIAIIAEALTFGLSIIGVSRLRIPEVLDDRRDKKGVIHESINGIKYVLRDSTLRPLGIATLLSTFCTDAAFAIIPLFFVRTLHISPIGFGIAFAIPGAVAVLVAPRSGLLLNKFGIRRLLVGCYLVSATCGTLLALCPRGIGWLPLLCVALGGWSASVVVNLVVSATYIMQWAPRDTLGTVNGAMRFLALAAAPIGSVVGGIVAQHLGMRNTLLIFGVAAFAAASPLLTLNSRNAFRQKGAVDRV